MSLSDLRNEITDLAGSLFAPLRALAVTLAGVWLAWRWLAGAQTLPLVVLLSIIVVAYCCDAIGRLLLPNRPRLALAFMEWWIVAPLALGAAGSALLVVIAVKLSLPEDAPVERKELIGALSAGLTTFLTSAFISWTGDQDASRAAKRIQRAFFSKFRRADPQVAVEPAVKYFRQGSLGERLVYSDAVAGVQGWSYEARRTRASELAKELKSGDSDPPPSGPAPPAPASRLQANGQSST